MKKTIFLLLLFSAYFSYGQQNAVKTPERIIIANGEIITTEQFNEMDVKYIKSMDNGVSDERRAELFKKFGNKIGPKEFILEINLWTEEEMKERANTEEASTSALAHSQTPPPPTEFISIEQSYVLNVNDTIKDFTVQMLNGETVKLSDLKGQVVLLNFWATWCAPCIREFYAFPSQIIEPFNNSAFVLLPVSRGETMDKVKEKMEQLKKDGIDFNVGIDPDRSIFDLYAKEGIPKNFLIDKNGIIRYVSTGYSEERMNDLVSMIQELLDEIEPLSSFNQETTDDYGKESGDKSFTKKRTIIISVLGGLLVIAFFVISYRLRKKNS
jgi:peroxiredoxin